jgi:hypothetical protein
MSKQVQSSLLILIFLALSCAALATAHITGDGGEYFLMTHSLFKHGSVTIGAADVADYVRMGPEALHRIGLQPTLLDELLRQAQAAKPDVVSGGFFPNAPGRFYSIHFWLYSLLALPFYALLKPLGLNPAAAFVVLNILCTGAVFAYLRRIAPRIAPLAFLAFLVAGTTIAAPVYSELLIKKSRFITCSRAWPTCWNPAKTNHFINSLVCNDCSM